VAVALVQVVEALVEAFDDALGGTQVLAQVPPVHRVVEAGEHVAQRGRRLVAGSEAGQHQHGPAVADREAGQQRGQHREADELRGSERRLERERHRRRVLVLRRPLRAGHGHCRSLTDRCPARQGRNALIRCTAPQVASVRRKQH
jgi:hypothetical protein